jgi:inner membrane protein
VDPVTHTLVGVGLGNAFFRKSAGKGAVPIMAIASNLPDVDAVVHLTGSPTAILLRRTFGHSLFMLPLWSLVLAVILKRFYPKLGLGRLFGMSLLGAGVHVFFDLINSFGVVLLWPFSDWRPEFGIIFIIDLILTGLLLLPVLICIPRTLRPRLTALSRVALACVALYIGFCEVNRIRATDALAAETGRLGLRSDFSYVFPEPLGPHRWRGVMREGHVYRLFLIHSISERIEPRDEIRTWTGDPDVEEARRTPLARRLEWFFKAPVWTVVTGPSQKPAEVTVRDLRFDSLVIRRGLPFVYRFKIEGPGRVEFVTGGAPGTP